MLSEVKIPAPTDTSIEDDIASIHSDDFILDDFKANENVPFENILGSEQTTSPQKSVLAPAPPNSVNTKSAW